MKTVIIPVYTTSDDFHPFYCEECKPVGKSVKETIVVSDYDHFCSGCGEDFLDIAERKNYQLLKQV